MTALFCKSVRLDLLILPVFCNSTRAVAQTHHVKNDSMVVPVQGNWMRSRCIGRCQWLLWLTAVAAKPGASCEPTSDANGYNGSRRGSSSSQNPVVRFSIGPLSDVDRPAGLISSPMRFLNRVWCRRNGSDVGAAKRQIHVGSRLASKISMYQIHGRRNHMRTQTCVTAIKLLDKISP